LQARPISPLPTPSSSTGSVPERKLSGTPPTGTNTKHHSGFGDYQKLPERPSSSPNPFTQHIQAHNNSTSNNTNATANTHNAYQQPLPTPNVIVSPSPERKRGTIGLDGTSDESSSNATAMPVHSRPLPLPHSTPSSTLSSNASTAGNSPQPTGALNTSTTKRRTVVSPGMVSSATGTSLEFGFGDSNANSPSTVTQPAPVQPAVRGVLADPVIYFFPFLSFFYSLFPFFPFSFFYFIFIF
jgi:hypothetical protein